MAPPLRFEKFGGMIPALDERLLPMENAVYTENAFLQAGRLEPLAADINIHPLTNQAARYAFRVPIKNPGIENLKDSYWLEFGVVDTYVVRSPVTDSSDGGRYYWANGNAPPGYTTKARLAVNDPVHGTAPGTMPPLVLGIPRPSVAPTVVPAGGSSPTITPSYLYTWVSASFEEGPPSLPTTATGNTGASWTIGLTAPTVADMANRTLTYTRIYRTEVSPDGGDVGFFLVVQLPIATLSYVDTVAPEVVANSLILNSENFSAPPDDLKGMVSMPNGMIAGWRNNEIWFCEPYRPHAWPSAYVLGVEAPIVGLGTIDQSVMILTSGQPYVATGIHPSVMSLRKVQPLEPCTAPGSIVNTPGGVLYSSYNGLILIGPSGGKNLTFDTIRKDEWQRLLNLQTLQASYFMQGYYCYSSVVDGVFQNSAPTTDTVNYPFNAFQQNAFQQQDFLGTRKGAYIAGDLHLGYMTLTCDHPTYNVMTDIWTGETLVIRDAIDPETGLLKNSVLHVDRAEYVPRQSYKWRSKIIQLPFKDNYAAAKIFFDQPLGDPPSEPTFFRMYANGVLKSVWPVTKSGKQFRLPSGYKADFYQFELEGQLMIFNLQVAASARELREV